MAKTVVLDELHITVRVPNDLPEDRAEVVRQTLAGDGFIDLLRRSVRAAFRAFPELASCRVSLTR